MSSDWQEVLGYADGYLLHVPSRDNWSMDAKNEEKFISEVLKDDQWSAPFNYPPVVVQTSGRSSTRKAGNKKPSASAIRCFVVKHIRSLCIPKGLIGVGAWLAPNGSRVCVRVRLTHKRSGSLLRFKSSFKARYFLAALAKEKASREMGSQN